MLLSIRKMPKHVINNLKGKEKLYHELQVQILKNSSGFWVFRLQAGRVEQKVDWISLWWFLNFKTTDENVAQWWNFGCVSVFGN